MTAFEEVYQVDGPRLVAEIFAVTGSLPEAEDLVQEAFVRAYARWPRVGAMEAPAAWVRRVALNLAISRWRSLRRAAAFGRRLRVAEATHESQSRHEETIWLVTALQKLPQRQRVAIVLHYWADLPVTTVADLMRLPESTVKSHLRRARATLAPLLALDTDDDPRGVTAR